MVYVERAPGADLRPWIRSMWYCCAPEVPHARERVLPNGCMQVLVNLAAESLTDCGDDGKREVKTSGALVMGARSRYEIVATKDMAEIAGVVIEPGGFAGMFGMRADLLRGSSASLDEVWSGTGGMLAERLREAEGGEGKLCLLEAMLRSRLRVGVQRSWMVDAALLGMRGPGMTVRECAREIGVRERRLLAVFREEVGMGPKAWMRVQRFQRAAEALHRGLDVRWAELALACGYYDQSHFANDFQEFSGVDPTTYSRERGRWQNHVAMP